ncbi:MAG: hypothetical protein JXR64_07445 [Spirochaetales bacterium]|nr:hypothetical protein [Spirochaetales bacterium]
MKRMIISLMMVAGTVSMVSAYGMGGRNSDNRGNGYRQDGMEERHEELFENEEVVTLSGKLELVNGERAKLVSNGTTYYLMAPWQFLIDLELKNGDKISAEGVEISMPMQWDNKEKSFVIKSVTINGKKTEVDLDADYAPMGLGGGMMGSGKGDNGRFQNRN